MQWVLTGGLGAFEDKGCMGQTHCFATCLLPIPATPLCSLGCTVTSASAAPTASHQQGKSKGWTGAKSFHPCFSSLDHRATWRTRRTGGISSQRGSYASAWLPACPGLCAFILCKALNSDVHPNLQTNSGSEVAGLGSLGLLLCQPGGK
jgi:hypothetical protein